ncbi:MAG TPA: GFA family protein [Gaiellaceae bacterium]
MVTRRAACSCGQLGLVAEGEPIRISVCHCLACQRRTGSTFGMQARFPMDRVRVDGRSTEYVRVSDDGDSRRYHFCPECGATVYYFLDGVPDAIAVPVGAFADPAFPPPRISIYESRRHGWVVVPEDIEHHDD